MVYLHAKEDKGIWTDLWVNNKTEDKSTLHKGVEMKKEHQILFFQLFTLEGTVVKEIPFK